MIAKGRWPEEDAAVASVRPFKGIRPRPDIVEKVASPPYDVITSDEAREIAAGNPLSFLHVVKAEIGLPAGVDVHSAEVYKASLDNFERMREQGVFIQDPVPCFYVYRLRMGDHVQTGLAVGASVDEYESGGIKKHELTRPDKEDDRARHVETLKANAGPVLFTYRHTAEIRRLIDRVTSRSDPEYDFQASDSVCHTLWVVSDADAVTQLREAFGSVPALYVADGHHRTASASRVRRIMREGNASHTGDEEYNFFLAVLFPDDELRIMGYHRAVKDLRGLSDEQFLERVAENFHVEDTTTPDPDAPRQFGMHLSGRWYRLTAKHGTYPTDDPVEGLDVSILQTNLFAPILGIADPRTDTRIDFVGGIRGTGELERRCRHDMRVAFALAPVSVEQLMAIADAGAIMPPKSTWFEPKLRSGVVIRGIV